MEEETKDCGKIASISLATKYRLSITPKRSEQRKVTRKKLTDASLKNINKGNSGSGRKFSDGVNSWMRKNDDEEFDFDAEDDGFCDAPTEDMFQTYNVYLQACSRLEIRPIRCIYEAFKKHKDTLRCKELVMKNKDIKACSIALIDCSCVDTLHFDNNYMGGEGAVYFGDVLLRNTYLADVRIAFNDLGFPEAEAICNALQKNMNVKRLDLRANKFGDDSAKFFKDLLVENSALRELYLGQNNFRETGGELIAEGLANNDFLVLLDLSWNHLRLSGAAAIGKSLEKNNGLEVLNLAFNGFSTQGTQALAEGLEMNRSLIDLDISNNRIPEVSIAQLLKGLQKNMTLLNLRIGRNHFTPKGPTSMIDFIRNCTDMALNYIDLSDLHVQEDFVSLLDEINKTRYLKVDYGGVWANDREPLGQQDQSEDEMALLEENPLYVLMEIIKAMEFRIVDLFLVFDKDQSKSLTIDEFKEGLEAMKIPLKKKSLEKLVKSMDSDRNGEVDFVELNDANRQYKDKLKEYIKDGIPIETTEIGRIAKLVRKIIKENTVQHAAKYALKWKAKTIQV